MGNTAADLEENGLTMNVIKNEVNDYHTVTLKPAHSKKESPDISNIYIYSETVEIAPNPKPKPEPIQTTHSKALSLIPKSNQCRNISSIFRYKKQLGKGASCRVLLVEHRKESQLYALKEMTRTVGKNASLFYSEVCILREIKHKNIVKIHDVYCDHCNFYICLEYCSGGTMLERIISDTHFSEHIASKYLKNILETVAFMHQHNIVHLDLKLNNIVFNKKPNKNKKTEPTLKIIDFGLSEEIKDESKIYDEIHGSLHYFPPEIFNDEGRRSKDLKKGDIWSIGIVSYLILSGKLPFYGNSQKQIINKIRKGTFDWPKNVQLSDECKSFVSSLLCADSAQRVSAAQALKHVWITGTANNIDLGNKLMKKLHNFNFKNNLQRILINSILSEMNNKEKNILLEGIADLDSNNDGFVDEQDIMDYILQNQGNYYMKNQNYSDTQSHSKVSKHIKQRSEDIISEMKMVMSLLGDTVIRNEIMDVVEQAKNEENVCNNVQSQTEEKDNGNVSEMGSDENDNELLQDLMDEIEVDFIKDYDFHITDAEENGQKNSKTDSVHIKTANKKPKTNLNVTTNIGIGYSSESDKGQSENANGSISVALFRKIMNKPAKNAAINVDGIVEELDPNGSGIIDIRLINSFGKRLSCFKMVPSPIESGYDNNGNSIENLSESTVILTPQKNTNVLHDCIEENVHEDSDSEIDFPEHLFVD